MLDLSVDFCMDVPNLKLEHWLLVAYGFLVGSVKHNPNLNFNINFFILSIFIHFAYSGQKGTG